MFEFNMRDDPEFNIMFCELVELMPCLYDKSCSDYNKDSQDEAWVKIGEHLKERALDCKERWKSIKAGYTRNRKQKSLLSETEAKQIKDYYLTAHLQFLEPFLVSRKTKNKMVTLPTREGAVRGTDEEMESSNEHSEESAPDVNDTWESDYPDRMFLQSLLPDMKLMDARTKRVFKLEVLKIADRLLNP